jgi:hypothetical protein
LLIFFIIAAFLTGRAIANCESEGLRLEFYQKLRSSPFSACIDLLFEEENLPITNPILPGCVSSSAEGIVPPSGSVAGEIIEIAVDGESFNASMIAIKNPHSLFMGKSTFNQNYVSEIMHRAGASYAFSAADDRAISVAVYDGVISESAEGTFFGITESGILAFGDLSAFKEAEDGLVRAQNASIHTLVCASMPTSFSPSEHPIGKPSLSIGQCADGSLLIAVADGNASVSDLTRLFYKYSAVNAAIVYIGDCAGIICPDGRTVSFGEGFDAAQYSHAWLIK